MRSVKAHLVVEDHDRVSMKNIGALQCHDLPLIALQVYHLLSIGRISYGVQDCLRGSIVLDHDALLL